MRLMMKTESDAAMPGGEAEAFDVIVVGAGATGSFAAIALARTGLRIAHVAPLAGSRDERTSALLAGSVTLLKRFDLWATLAPIAAPLRTMRIVDATGGLIRAPEIAFESAEIGLEAFGYNMRNAGLLAALAERAGSLANLVRIDDTVVGTDSGDDAVALTTAGGRRLSARLAVAADGRRSALRQAAGIAARETRYDQSALVVNLRHDHPHHDTSTEFHTRTGPFTLVPLGERSSSVVCVERPAIAEALAAMDDAGLARELERRAQSLLGRFTIDGPRQTFPIASLVAATMAGGRIALVGEAGHALPPIGAQGLNLGLRDVAALADICAEAARNGGDPGSAAALDRYRRARRADVLTRSAAIDLVNRSLLAGFLPVDLARVAVLSVANAFAPVRRLLMQAGLAAGRNAPAARL
jgi:2-octaprenyl-6-methoxyphenol hydroxylase